MAGERQSDGPRSNDDDTGTRAHKVLVTLERLANNRAAANAIGTATKLMNAPILVSASIGRNSGDAVSQEYRTPGTFKGDTILFVGVTVEKAQYLDLEKLAVAAMAAD
jgi:hypothetical protein